MIWAQTHPGLSTSAWRLCCDWKSFGVWLRLNLVHCESQRRLFGCTLLMSNVENFAPWVDETEFNSILMVQMLVLLVAVSLSHSDKCPHAVIPLLNGLPIFSGQRANPTQGSVTLSFLGTSHPGMNSETSMPLVSLKPWNKFPSSFPADFWQQSGFACGCIDGSNFERGMHAIQFSHCKKQWTAVQKSKMLLLVDGVIALSKFSGLNPLDVNHCFVTTCKSKWSRQQRRCLLVISVLIFLLEFLISNGIHNFTP